jgi:hypothetical protein
MTVRLIVSCLWGWADAKKILYLSSMAEAGMGQGDLDKIKVLGSRTDQCSYRFKNSPLLHFSAALEA